MATYRADIDGLRALAVIPVLIFHVFPDYMPGGYIGVDIFFVISGYLITGILLGEVAQRKFSVLRFYIRRARRLFPAFLLVLLAVLLLGRYVLLPNEFSLLGKHIMAGSVFISNIVLWREVGYFDASADQKPLLHLWSLGVEEQYYLLWPLLVLVLARRQKLFLPVAILLTLVSFVLNIIVVERSASTAFYLPATRIWELLVGSILAFVVRTVAVSNDPKRRPLRLPELAFNDFQRDLLSLAGAAMLLAALITFDKSTLFPGWAALLPVFGSAFIIAAGPRALINRSLLSSRPAVWFGLISYPLYLWHWPLVAYAHIVYGKPLPPFLGLAIIGTAIGLAWLTYRYVEQWVAAPRRSQFAGRDAAKLWALIGGLGIYGVVMWIGWLQPVSARLPIARSISAAQLDWQDVDNGVMKGDSPERVLFIGDSLMQQYLPRIEKIMHDRSVPVYSVQIITKGGCAPLRGVDRRSIHCRAFVEEAYAEARDESVKTIVIAASWFGFSLRDDYYLIDSESQKNIQPFADENRWIFDAWSKELAELVRSGKRVFIVTNGPSGTSVDPLRFIDRKDFNWRAVVPSAPSRGSLESIVALTNARVVELAHKAGAQIIDPFDWLCDADKCPVSTVDGDPIFIDEGHLRSSYVKNRLPMLDRFVYMDAQPQS